VLRRLAALGATLVAASAVALAPLEAAPKRDYAGSAWTILPPGENGSLTFNRNTRDQALMYDALTPRAGSVTLTDIRRTFKQAPLGASVIGGRRERPRAGVTIARDPLAVAARDTPSTGASDDPAHRACNNLQLARNVRLLPHCAAENRACNRL
jgi:hypothetical protein